MSYMRCVVGRCQEDSDLIVWTAPLCQRHWQQCCDEEPGCSLRWIRKKARKDVVATLSEMPKMPPRRVAKSAHRPPTRVRRSR